MTDQEQKELASRIDAHCILLLRSNGTQASAVAWMKTAFNLMEESAKELRSRPTRSTVVKTIYVPAEPVIVVASHIPKEPPKDFHKPHAIWVEGVTVPYGDRFQNRNQPWTQADTRRLVAQRARERAKLK